jgi:hypothetical protein
MASAIPLSSPRWAAHLDEQRVPGGMTEGVVDLLESVEIDEHQREFAFVAPSHPDRCIQQMVEHRPIGQTRQSIVSCQILHPIFGLFSLSRAIEILERERNVVCQPLQESCSNVGGTRILQSGRNKGHGQNDEGRGLGKVAGADVERPGSPVKWPGRTRPSGRWSGPTESPSLSLS